MMGLREPPHSRNTRVLRRLVISLHDATPFHLERMRRAEAVFRDLGIDKIAYLLVPEYHGGYPCAESPEFIAWCREDRPFQVDWQLHGFHHLESPDAGGAGEAAPSQGGLGDAFKRRFLTGGEGEFLALDAATQRLKLEKGREVFRKCLGADPQGFVAPAWLFNSTLLPTLKELGFLNTEDHRRMYRVQEGRSIASPVITWATRTLLRKFGSLAVCPALARLWSNEPVLRVAMHPFDFDHPATVANIRSVLRRVMRERGQAFGSDLDFSEKK